MAKYKPYRTMKSNITQKLRKLMMRRNPSKQMKRKVRSASFGDEVIKEFFTMPEAYHSLDAAILMDEFQWQRKGGTIYFPESPFLLEMLWRSKMQVDPDYLLEFPESFVVSWPNGTVINGLELPPILVNYASFNDRNEVFVEFRDKYLSSNTERTASPGTDKDSRNLHISYLNEEFHGPNGESMYNRSSVPKEKVVSLLTSDEALHEIGGYKGHGVEKLSPEDIKMQWTISRMLLHLLVYMQARPDSVIPGWPDKVKERDFTTKQNPEAMPTVIKSPIPRDGSGHASPEAHWRNAHFRSYPERKDGTRRKGVVFVTGCLVNAEVDPNTVVKVV